MKGYGVGPIPSIAPRVMTGRGQRARCNTVTVDGTRLQESRAYSATDVGEPAFNWPRQPKQKKNGNQRQANKAAHCAKYINKRSKNEKVPRMKRAVKMLTIEMTKVFCLFYRSVDILLKTRLEPKETFREEF